MIKRALYISWLIIIKIQFQARPPSPAFPRQERIHTQAQQQISQWASTAPSSPKRTPTVPATLSVDRGKGTAAGALRTSSISCPLFQTRLPATAFPGRERFHTQPQQQISQWASTAPPARSARRPCQLHWVWIGEKGLPRAPSARAASPARFLLWSSLLHLLLVVPPRSRWTLASQPIQRGAHRCAVHPFQQSCP